MCSVAGVFVAGAVLKAYGDQQSAQAESDIADTNARIMRQRADDAANRGGQAAGRQRMKGSQDVATATTQLAKGDVELTSPMATNIFETTDAFAEMDAQQAKANAAREAWGYTVEAKEQEMKSDLARRKSILGPAGDIIGGLGAGYAASKKA